MTNGTCFTSKSSVGAWMERNKYHLPHIDILPPDDGLQISLKHVEVWKLNKVKINSASCWFIIQIQFKMHGQRKRKQKVDPFQGLQSMCHVRK
jgi:hypothetical protein